MRYQKTPALEPLKHALERLKIDCQDIVIAELPADMQGLVAQLEQKLAAKAEPALETAASVNDAVVMTPPVK